MVIYPRCLKSVTSGITVFLFLYSLQNRVYHVMKAKTQTANLSDSPDLFQHAWMNKLTRTHISVPVSIFLLYAIGLIISAYRFTDLNTAQIISLYVGGFFFFTLVEYILHRWLYHPPEDATESRKNFTYKIHGIHHDYPKDKKRLALPPWLSVIVATVLLFIFKLIISHYSFAFLAGFLTGYAFYLLVHYAVHIFKPPNNIFKALWTNHAIHHYSEDEILFGVSSPFWDYVFRTRPKQKTPKKVIVGS